MIQSEGLAGEYFGFSADLTVDDQGFVYVVESAANRVQKFEAGGEYVKQWGALGTGDGAFDEPQGIDTGTPGEIVVADTENDRVQVFNSDGVFLRKWSSTGGWFSFTPIGIAVDGQSNVFVADWQNGYVKVFDTSGLLKSFWTIGGAWALDIDDSCVLYAPVAEEIVRYEYPPVPTEQLSWGRLKAIAR